MTFITGPVVQRIVMATQLHDRAIKNWAITMDVHRTESQLIQSLEQFHNACQKHLQDAPIVNSCSRFRGTLALSVDVKPTVMDCYGRAFLLNTTYVDGESTLDTDNITLMAAIMFYNVGLLYHIRLQDGVPSSPTARDLDCWAVRQYYEKANTSLGRYMDSTREPLWTLQAAIWHNLADSYRLRIGNDPVSWVYFELLESIHGWMGDKSDRIFFERAIAIARMQQFACMSATAA